MNDLLISVIVPVYNPGAHLENCIDSIVNQSFKNLEIILVDDGSTDGSSEVCDAWAEKDSRFKVIHKANGGASAARNIGLDAATGDYLGFVDADDYIDLDMYECLLKDILDNNADAARCGIDRVFSDGRTEEWGTNNPTIILVDNAELLKDIGTANGLPPVSLGNKLFKSDCINDIRFDTKYKFAEDTLFNFQVALNISVMVYHDVDRYHYRFNDDSITNKGINENNFDEHRVMDIIFSLADEETLPYCVKGDILKSFRTIRQISESGKYIDRFDEIRLRIIKNKKAVFKSGLYSKETKLKTLLLWLTPWLYRIIVKQYSKKKYG